MHSLETDIDNVPRNNVMYPLLHSKVMYKNNCSTCFAYSNLCSSHIVPILQVGKQKHRALLDLPKAIERLSAGAGLVTQKIWLQSLLLLTRTAKAHCLGHAPLPLLIPLLRSTLSIQSKLIAVFGASLEGGGGAELC